MLDHLTLQVSDLQAARAFYEAALAPLGYRVAFDEPETFGMNGGTGPDFWVAEGRPNGLHLAFRAKDEAAVQAFHAAALAAGGTDNGAPGPRTHYHPYYYAAFVLDADGNNIEAVFHEHGGKR